MKKKIMIIVFACLIVAGGVGFFVYRTIQYDARISRKIVSSNHSDQETASSQILKEYNDPAGFKFSYPASVGISPVTTTDSNTYSSIVATTSSNLGSITIEAVSSNVLTLDSLIKSKTEVIDSKLADLNAKQYKEKDKIVTLALDKGVLFTITASNSAYWKEVNNKIISSFIFALPEKTQVEQSSSPSSSDSDISLEGEETIE